MTCIKAQSLITPFINDKLSIDDLDEFLDHVNSCPNCREELEVYYALLTAMKQLDEDKNLSSNFVQELNEKLENAQEKVIQSKYTYYRKIAILILIMISLAFFISISYAYKSEEEHATITKKSDFHIRYQFLSTIDPSLDQQLQDYLERQNQITNVPESRVQDQLDVP